MFAALDFQKPTAVPGSYRILDQKQAAFTVASYDARKHLVIDPTLDFTTTFGGSLENFPAGIAVDSQGNAYVVGYTLSTDFPQVGTLLGPQECTMSESPLGASVNRLRTAIIGPQIRRNAIGPNASTASNSFFTPFVTKLSPQGQMLFSSYMGGVGGPGSASANAVAADSTGGIHHWFYIQFELHHQWEVCVRRRDQQCLRGRSRSVR